MIYLTGNLKPTKEQKKIVLASAGHTFTDHMPSEFYGDPLPEFCAFKTFTPAIDSGIALKMKIVAPHTDSAFSLLHTHKRVAMFWLIKGNISLVCGQQEFIMNEGDYAFFDDSLMHSVHPPHNAKARFFYGVAIQYYQNHQIKDPSLLIL